MVDNPEVNSFFNSSVSSGLAFAMAMEDGLIVTGDPSPFAFPILLESLASHVLANPSHPSL